MAFGLPGEYVLVADGVITPQDRAYAKKLLGRLNDSVQAGAPITQSLKQRAADGTTYVAKVGPGYKNVFVVRPLPVIPKVTSVLVDLWIPHGFVFVPGDADSPQGYGLPVRMSSGDVFAADNTSPGMATDRWTASGPCGQVLLTNVSPDVALPPHAHLLPLAFDVSQGAVASGPPVAPVPWYAVRARFNDYTWDPASRGARQAYWKAVVAKAPSGYRLPFATHYDDAQTLATMLDAYHALSGMPPWFATTTQRANKDGIPLQYGEGYSIGVPTPTQLAAELATPTTNTWPALDVGIGTTSVGLTTAVQDGWIDAGNMFWHPADATLPTLSWFGYPALNLPGYITEAGFTSVGSTLPDLSTLTYEWRQGATLPLYSKNLYSMGRCIGTLPEIIFGAGIATVQRTDAHGHPKTYYQVRVITWNVADQPTNGSIYNYMWKFNVWFVETAPVLGVPLHFADMPVGTYDAVSNPSGWIKGASFVLQPGADPLDNLLRLLGQAWRFSPTGATAVAHMYYTTSPSGTIFNTPLEVAFTLAAGDSLDAQITRPAVAAMSVPFFNSVVAIDYDTNGDYACVYQCNYPTSATLPLPPGAESGYPPNAPTSLEGIAAKWFWSGGGDGEIVSWYGGSGIANTCPTVELWVLDPAAGAFAVGQHWTVGTDPGVPMTLMYYIRLCRRGARVATDLFTDTASIDDFDTGYYTSMNELKVGYSRDRNGEWIFGYDFGATKNMTYLYTAPLYPNTYGTSSWPPAALATSSRWMTSHWLSSVGDPVAMSETEAQSTQLYPVGVV